MTALNINGVMEMSSSIQGCDICNVVTISTPKVEQLELESLFLGWFLIDRELTEMDQVRRYMEWSGKMKAHQLKYLNQPEIGGHLENLHYLHNTQQQE